MLVLALDARCASFFSFFFFSFFLRAGALDNGGARARCSAQPGVRRGGSRAWNRLKAASHRENRARTTLTAVLRCRRAYCRYTRPATCELLRALIDRSIDEIRRDRGLEGEIRERERGGRRNREFPPPTFATQGTSPREGICRWELCARSRLLLIGDINFPPIWRPTTSISLLPGWKLIGTTIEYPADTPIDVHVYAH